MTATLGQATLAAHRGHELAVVPYGTNDYTESLFIECVHCDTVLIAQENPYLHTLDPLEAIRFLELQAHQHHELVCSTPDDHTALITCPICDEVLVTREDENTISTRRAELIAFWSQFAVLEATPSPGVFLFHASHDIFHHQSSDKYYVILAYGGALIISKADLL